MLSVRVFVLLLGLPLDAAAAPARHAEELGQALVATYLQAIDDSATLLTARPDVDQVRAEFEALREAHIQTLVALGHQIQALDSGQHAQVERAVTKVNSRLQYDPELKPRYDAYFEAVRHYFAVDPQFGRRLQTINILSQYAFFDLLRQQEPAEAERLGITAPTTGVPK